LLVTEYEQFPATKRDRRCFSARQAVDGPIIKSSKIASPIITGEACGQRLVRPDGFLLPPAALDLPPGSEIIFPALTFWVVRRLRAAPTKPVFVDVDSRTFNLDPELIRAAINEHTRNSSDSSLRQPCEMGRVMRIADNHDLIVIEDCAQAAGARYRGQRVGTFGHASFFSFQMLKESTLMVEAWR
jgi:dTDP-4-amino-4,6-dideoxygalactose transaminase